MSQNNKRKLIAFGDENGVGIDGVFHTHIPQQILIEELEDYNNITMIYARYNTTVVTDT